MRLDSISLTLLYFNDESAENIFLDKNQFAGTIPSAVGKLTGLQNIDLGSNFMTGPLPLELQALTSLKKFAVVSNDLTGPFFEPFGVAWSQLEYLNLDGTRFTGTIPSMVLQQWASSLIDFHLGTTMLNGTLPKEVNSLTKLSNLNVASRNFGGPFPDISNLGSLGKCQ